VPVDGTQQSRAPRPDRRARGRPERRAGETFTPYGSATPTAPESAIGSSDPSTECRVRTTSAENLGWMQTWHLSVLEYGGERNGTVAALAPIRHQQAAGVSRTTNRWRRT
jgi:hypothetical protein